MIDNVVIADAVRSAVGRAHKGTLALTRPDELAGQVIAALLARVPQVKAADVEDLVLGCAMPEGEQGLNVARVVGLLAGLPQESGGVTINRFCSSGLQAIAMAAGAIAIGRQRRRRRGRRRVDDDGADDGQQARARRPRRWTASRRCTRRWASRPRTSRRSSPSRAPIRTRSRSASQQKAGAAQKAGAFDAEIVAVKATRYENGKHATTEFKRDELIRGDTTAEGLAGLKPAFSQGRQRHRRQLARRCRTARPRRSS